jgi:hypothetical protein
MPLLPAQVMDLSIWKINLCTGTPSTQISQPQLHTYADADFKAVPCVQFTAPVGGTVQAGAKYPRTELREMNKDGTTAAWSTATGTHTMRLTQCITHLPAVKPEVVAGQIHDPNEYVILIWLSRNTLSVMYGGGPIGVLDPNYQLNTVFTVKVVAGGGFIDVYYNGVLKVHQPDSREGCYFKAGCYTQSNPAHGDDPADYGQVEIIDLQISHA